MNRRNFFGTVGAAIAGAVLGSKVESPSTFTLGDSSGFVFGSLSEPYHSELRAKTFIREELWDNWGTVFYHNDMGEVVHLREYGQTFTGEKGYRYVPTKEGGRKYLIHWTPDGAAIDPSCPDCLPHWGDISPDWYGAWL